QADCGVGLVDGADRLDPRAVLARPRAIAERGFTRIAAARHNTIDPHYHRGRSYISKLMRMEKSEATGTPWRWAGRKRHRASARAAARSSVTNPELSAISTPVTLPSGAMWMVRITVPDSPRRAASRG